MQYKFSRRVFHTLALSTIVRGEAQPGYYRLKRSGDVWQIVAPDGLTVDHAPPISVDPLGTPFLAGVPVLPENKFADVFDPGVQQHMRDTSTGRAKSLGKNKELVAYVCTGVPAWNRAWVNWFRTLHADSPGKQQYVQFLKETYKYSIGDVNAVYGIDSTSFTDLGQISWNAAGLDRAKPRTDDEAFLGSIAQVLYSTAAEAIRKADRNHLVLSEHFDKTIASPVIQAAASVTDAIWLDQGVDCQCTVRVFLFM
jgi:hypothetical protein